MKKIFIIPALIFGLFGCSKKDEVKKVEPNQQINESFPSQINVTVNSNYKYPYLTIGNVTDNTSVKVFNYTGGYQNGYGYEIKEVFITYSFIAEKNKKYGITTWCVKNSLDSTIWMVDNKKVWNYLKVEKNGSSVYENKDTIGRVVPGTPHDGFISENRFTFQN